MATSTPSKSAASLPSHGLMLSLAQNMSSLATTLDINAALDEEAEERRRAPALDLVPDGD